MTITMLLVNTLESAERAVTHIGRGRHEPLPPMSNPLLDFSGLPCSTRSARARWPAIDLCWPNPMPRWRPVTAPIFLPLGRHVAGCWTWPPSAGPRLGRRQPPQQRGRHARTARRLQRALPAVTEFWTRLGADERLYAKYKAIDQADQR